MICTGYFAKLEEYALHGFQLISIANTNINKIGKLVIKKFKPLIPGNWIFNWKNDLKNRNDLGRAKIEYVNTYYSKCLSKFTPEDLVKDLLAFSNNHDAILLCYEKTPVDTPSNGIVALSQLEAGTSFCHRHLVSDFLRQAGYECREYIL